MILLFQLTEPAGKVMDHAFGISPDTVFGFVVALLVLIMLALTAAIIYLWRDKQSSTKETFAKIEALTSNSITVIQANVSVLTAIRESLDDLREKTPEQIRDVENRLTTVVERNGQALQGLLISMKK
jgi:hypothetical protein